WSAPGITDDLQSMLDIMARRGGSARRPDPVDRGAVTSPERSMRATLLTGTKTSATTVTRCPPILVIRVPARACGPGPSVGPPRRSLLADQHAEGIRHGRSTPLVLPPHDESPDLDDDESRT